MNIVFIIPGSGGSFYCGNCLRDSKLFEAIRGQGHNALKIPMYLPLFSHEENYNDTPVFYGAISIYLKQQFPLFRHAPQWLDNMLNSRPMLKFAASMANSTRAAGLEEMTISMLMGEHGKQKHELEKLSDWLKTHIKPDVVHISNALLLGLAHKLRENLKVPVVCSLQDEDVWVDNMHPEMAQKVWQLMREKSVDVDMFIPVSHYYTSFMKERLQLPVDKMATLHLGIDPADYHYVNASQKPRNIGFMSRLCRENGLDILVDAFILLKKEKDTKDIRLLLTGGYTGDDTRFIREQKKKLKQAGLAGCVEFVHDFEQQARSDFFNRIMLMSVPVRNGEAFGIYLTENMAAGIPVVQPALGAFPEIIESSGGGITYARNTPEELAHALLGLMEDKGKLERLSAQARLSMEQQFNIHGLAKEMTSVYERVVNEFHSKSMVKGEMGEKSFEPL
jgi:glycosyltransferase involved in cell wall biosynthesis